MAVAADPNPQFEQYAHPERIVSASWLSAHLGTPGLKVVESDEDALLYDIGHIPTAIRIDWRRDLGDATIRDIIDAEAFAELMRSKGIEREDTVVVYGDKANWWATYTAWVFELFGHPDVRILDGGRDSWMSEERDTAYAVPELPRSNYPVVERDDSTNRVYFAETLETLRSGSTQLVDVRTPEEYVGQRTHVADYPEEGVLRGGHIPTAVNVPWDAAVYANHRFRSRAELDKIYRDLNTEDNTIVYCRVGDRSAHTWYVLKYLLGFDHVRNYDGSWVEWGNMVHMPIATGEEPGNI